VICCVAQSTQETSMSFAPENQALAKPEALLRVPVGLASPLWGLFAGAAMTGATWWWMTRWARPQNLEALFAASETFEAAVEATPTLAEPTLELVEADGPLIETIVEAVVEAAPEPVVEPAVVAGGAVDVVLEAPEAAKPKKKPTAAKAD